MNEQKVNHAVEVEANLANLDEVFSLSDVGDENRLRQWLMEFGASCIERYMA